MIAVQLRRQRADLHPESKGRRHSTRRTAGSRTFPWHSRIFPSGARTRPWCTRIFSWRSRTRPWCTRAFPTGVRTFPSGARTFTWSTAAALLIALLPAVAAAHLAGSYQAFIDNPREAAQTLEAEIDGLTAELADLENAASEALAAYEASRERAVAAVRFYDAAVTGLTLHSIFGSGDLVELLAGLRALARAAERDLATLETYRALREDSLRTAAELEARQAALASRQALVPLFLRADEERRAFRVSHPDPAQAEAALLAEWQRQAPLALALLQHVRERLADGAALFREDPGGDRFVLTVDRLLDRLHPFPAEVAAQVDRLDVVILADHVYWALESGGAQTVLITWFEPLNRNRLRLTFEVILHRGLPVAADQVALINAFLPTEIDVSGLGVDARDVRHEDGLVTLPPADG